MCCVFYVCGTNQSGSSWDLPPPAHQDGWFVPPAKNVISTQTQKGWFLLPTKKIISADPTTQQYVIKNKPKKGNKNEQQE